MGRRSRAGRQAAMIRTIRADVANGHRVTLIALSTASVEEYAANFTMKELRLIRFEIPGLCFAAKPRSRRK